MRDFDLSKFHHALGGSDQTGGIEQNPYELDKLCDFIDDHDIKKVFEIGLGSGKLNLFLKDYGLDVWGVSPIKIEGVEHIVGKSQDEDVIESIGQVDLVFVDGDHSFNGVRLDYENYKSKCRFMAFHDIVGRLGTPDVKAFWEYMKKIYPVNHWEIIASNFDQCSGIGIIKIR